MQIVTPSVKLIWITPNSTAVIEEGARICYQSEPTGTETPEEFIKRIAVQKGHESVIEHASACFRIVTDRAISHEAVRHRLASYSQESTRYCNYSKEKFGSQIKVIEPPGLDEFQRLAWAESARSSEEAYLDLLARGCTPQVARAVLPNCLKTEFMMTTNFRNWLHFLKLRTSSAAHPQMRQIAKMIGEILAKECPALFGSYAIRCPVGCRGLDVGTAYSGCGCPDGKLADGTPVPPGFKCDCPGHPVAPQS